MNKYIKILIAVGVVFLIAKGVYRVLIQKENSPIEKFFKAKDNHTKEEGSDPDPIDSSENTSENASEKMKKEDKEIWDNFDAEFEEEMKGTDSLGEKIQADYDEQMRKIDSARVAYWRSQSIRLKDFDHIDVADGWEIILHKSDKIGISFDEEKIDIKYITASAQTPTLYIYSIKEPPENIKKVAHLFYTEMRQINVSENATVSANSIQSEELTLEIEGGGKILLSNITTDKLNGSFEKDSHVELNFNSVKEIDIYSNYTNLNLSNMNADLLKLDIGYTQARFSGTTQNLKLEGYSGFTNGSALTATNGDIKLSMAAKAKLRITGDLNLKLHRGSTLDLSGNPVITKQFIEEGSVLNTTNL